MVIRFADAEIDDQRREFLRAGGRVQLEPKVFDLILYLSRHRDRVVSKEELLDALWPGQEVFEGALSVCVHRARVALNGTRSGHDVIRTFVRRGYRLMAEPIEGPAPETDPAEAAALAERAAQDAFARLDFAEAAAQFGRAAALLKQDQPDERSRLVRLIIGRGEALYRTGDEAGAREAFRLAQALPRPAPQPGESQPADASQLTAEGERFLVLIRTGIEFVSGARGGDWFEEISFGASALDAAADEARRTGNLTALASDLVSRSWVALSCELPPERLPRSAEALLLAEAVGKPHLVHDARLLYIHDLLENGRVEDAATQIDAYSSFVKQVPSPVYEWVGGYLAATRALLAGRLAESYQLALNALARGATLAPEQSAAFFATQFVTVRAHQGHLGDMVGALEMLVLRYPEHSIAHATLANAYCETGRMEDARLAVEKAIESGLGSGVLRSSLMPYAIASLAPACAALGAASRAASLYETLLPWSGTQLVSSPAVAYLGPVDGYLGILARVAGRWPRAVQHFEAAIEDCTRIGCGSMVARSKLEYARGLLLHGKRRAALEMLDDADGIARELELAGLRPWIAELRNE